MSHDDNSHLEALGFSVDWPICSTECMIFVEKFSGCVFTETISDCISFLHCVSSAVVPFRSAAVCTANPANPLCLVFSFEKQSATKLYPVQYRGVKLLQEPSFRPQSHGPRCFKSLALAHLQLLHTFSHQIARCNSAMRCAFAPQDVNRAILRLEMRIAESAFAMRCTVLQSALSAEIHCPVGHDASITASAML